MTPTKTRWKGKEKAVEAEFEDLDPVITYKHLLSSSNMGVHDPLRVISLVDSDAFYASCEMVRLGVDPEQPLGVQQWEALIAVNYPARKFGISRMDSAKDAKEKCPHIMLVHVPTYMEGQKEPGYWEDVDTKTHKVSLDVYRRESMKIHAMFKEKLPTAEIEKASIDEAFFDLTKPIRRTILERYPELAQPPADAPKGFDTPLPKPPPINWDGLGNLIPLNRDARDSSQQDSTTWHDVALAIGAEMMMNVREEVYQKLGYTTSAGIARNKFLAKLSASYRKLKSQNILRNAAIPNYLIPMPFQKIRFLGGKLGEAVAQQYDAKEVGDLLRISLHEIQNTFGEAALWIWEAVRGIDRAEVKEKSIINKSMLASKNLAKPITEASEGGHWIRVLAAELALRLNDARSENANLWPKTITLHARKGYQQSRSKQAPFPFTRQVTVDVVAAAGTRLWDELVVKADPKSIYVTNVSLAFTGIEISEVGQRSLDGFLKRTREDDDDHSSSKEPPDTRHGGSDGSFVCSRCDKSISLPQSIYADEEERAQAAKHLRLEHSDFHFAQDLARNDSNADSGTEPGPGKGKKRKKPDKATRGIERFFKPTSAS